jgi:peptide deformylase
MANVNRIDRLRIVHYPDPVLRQTCAPIEVFDERTRQIAAKMLWLMREGKGIGLAAPQVGLKLRMFVCNTTGEPADDMVCINPELDDLEGAVEMEEGCLSLPNVSIPVRRAQHARIRAYDRDGNPYERRASDLLARVWQHENDHLDGHLIVDYMSDASRIANRRALRQLQDDYKQKNRKSA